PAYATDDLGLPELTMLVATDVAVVDHHEASVLLVANALVPPDAPADAVDAAYEDAVARLDAMTRDLATPAPPSVAVTRPVPPAEHVSRTPAGQYQPAVKAALDAVRAGEVFQVQIGQRFETRTDADALDIYRVLRTLNPSPYMYLLRLDGFDIVGSSPEALVTVTGGRAVLHPIAGTRKRGDTPERDAELAAELVSDVKERAEHVMLVDLARNDLGRAGRARRAHRLLPGRHAHRGAEGAGDGDHRRARAGPPRRVRRRGRLPRRRRRPRHGDRDPDRGGP